MKNLRFGALALSLTLLVVACSQGMSLEEYFSQMTEISNTQKQESDDLQTAADEQISTATDEAAQVELIQKFFADNLVVAEAALAEIKDISPPDEVKSAHEEFVAALDEMVAGFKEASTSIEEASTAADVSTVIQELGPTIEEASAKFDSSCNELQKVADDNDIDADLACGEGESSSEGSDATPAPTMAPSP